MTTPDKDKVDATDDLNDKGAGEPIPSAAGAEAEVAGSEEPATKADNSEEPAQADADQNGEGEVVEATIIEEAEAVVAAAAAEAEAVAAAESELVAQAKAEAAEWQDKYMRLHAEWDTYRRRMNEQREQEKVRAAEKMVSNLIPVIDDFERTIEYAVNNGETGLLGGVKAVHSKLVNTLEKEGVGVIDPAGQAFDALEAQAVGTVDDASVPDETVAQVYQKGYRLGVKVLRPAMVTITTGGPKREAEAAE